MNFCISENQDFVFSRDEVTLHDRVSVRPSVGRSVGNAFAFQSTRNDLCHIYALVSCDKANLKESRKTPLELVSIRRGFPRGIAVICPPEAGPRSAEAAIRGAEVSTSC